MRWVAVSLIVAFFLAVSLMLATMPALGQELVGEGGAQPAAQDTAGASDTAHSETPTALVATPQGSPAGHAPADSVLPATGVQTAPSTAFIAISLIVLGALLMLLIKFFPKKL